MHLVYIDDSQEPPLYVFSAIAVPEARWHDTFASVRSWRRQTRDTDGIYLRKELHAWKFVGRRKIAPDIVTKSRRCELFGDAIRVLAAQRDVHVFNACLPHRQSWAFGRLLNRINKAMASLDSFALLICDEGNEADYARLVRRMGVHNPTVNSISIFGCQRFLSTKQSIGTKVRHLDEVRFFRLCKERILNDSLDRYIFPCCSRVLPNTKSRVFEHLGPICVQAANPRDPFGVIR
jgi:hypothetical protein